MKYPISKLKFSAHIKKFQPKLEKNQFILYYKATSVINAKRLFYCTRELGVPRGFKSPAIAALSPVIVV